MLVTLNDVLPRAKAEKYAVGLFNTMVNIVFLLFTNWLSNKTTESSLF